MRRTRESYLVNSLLSGAVLYWALDLSSADRGVVDYAVLGAVCAAIVWNVVQLGRRLHRVGGGRAIWHLQRTLLFLTIGLLNTVLIRHEQIGTWRYWLGWIVLVLAAIDTVALYRIERRDSDRRSNSHELPATPR